MSIVNYAMTYAPPFSESSLIHCPLNAVLDWPMCMPSGYSFFRDLALNAQLKRVLNTWRGFLNGPHSCEHLTVSAPTGWFSPAADKYIGLSQFGCLPDEAHWGFASWNAFFTRQFGLGMRPVAAPGDEKVIVSACEASPYNIQHSVKLCDTFWIKAQPYSLMDIFTARRLDLAKEFIGGSVYQTSLSAFSYHRWHALVSGGGVARVFSRRRLLLGRGFLGKRPEQFKRLSGIYFGRRGTRCDSNRQRRCVDRQRRLYICRNGGSVVLHDRCASAAARRERRELGYFQYGGSTCCLVCGPRVVRAFVQTPPFNSDASPVKSEFCSSSRNVIWTAGFGTIPLDRERNRI